MESQKGDRKKPHVLSKFMADVEQTTHFEDVQRKPYMTNRKKKMVMGDGKK